MASWVKIEHYLINPDQICFIDLEATAEDAGGLDEKPVGAVYFSAPGIIYPNTEAQATDALVLMLDRPVAEHLGRLIHQVRGTVE